MKFTINTNINNTKLQKYKNTKQKTLESHVFKSLLNVKIKRIESINKSYSHTYLPPTYELKDNKPRGVIMITNCEDYIRIFYININGLDLSKEEHS